MKLNPIFRTILSLILTIVLCISLPVTALADSDKDKGKGNNKKEETPAESTTDSSKTHLYFKENGEQAPFTKDSITVNINGIDYTFTDSGNNSWYYDNAENPENILNELDIQDGENGEEGYIDIIIKHGEDEYTAKLTNHSNKNGNNGDSKKGTDTYDISGIQKKPAPLLLLPRSLLPRLP